MKHEKMKDERTGCILREWSEIRIYNLKSVFYVLLITSIDHNMVKISLDKALSIKLITKRDHP